jgi:hypothetical protein
MPSQPDVSDPVDFRGLAAEERHFLTGTFRPSWGGAENGVTLKPA